jgi:hypothetical protein
MACIAVAQGCPATTTGMTATMVPNSGGSSHPLRGQKGVWQEAFTPDPLGNHRKRPGKGPRRHYTTRSTISPGDGREHCGGIGKLAEGEGNKMFREPRSLTRQLKS